MKEPGSIKEVGVGRGHDGTKTRTWWSEEVDDGSDEKMGNTGDGKCEQWSRSRKKSLTPI